MRLKARWVQDRSCRRRGETSRQSLVWDVMDGVDTTSIRAQPWCVPFLRGERCQSNDISCLMTQLCLSACKGMQRTGEGPRGSFTAVLCGFLGQRVFLENGLSCATNRGSLTLIRHRETPLPIIPHAGIPSQVRLTSV